MNQFKTPKFHCEKIVEGVYNFGREFEMPGLALANLRMLEEWVAKCLRQNQSSADPEVPDQTVELDFKFGPIKHVIFELTNFLERDRDVTVDERMTAYVFAIYLHDHLPDLLKEYGK